MKNKCGEPALFHPIAQSNARIVQIAEQWNREIVSFPTTLMFKKNTSFDFNVCIPGSEKNLLHLAVANSHLTVISILCSCNNINTLVFDNNLNLPSRYVNPNFLTSKKLYCRKENAQIHSYFHGHASSGTVVCVM